MKRIFPSFNAPVVKPEHNSISRWIKILDIIAYIGCIVFIIYFASRWGLAFLDPYVQNNDVRQAIFPFWRFHNEALFKDDFITNVMSAFTPWFYKTFYYLLTFVFDLLTATKIVQIITVTWAAFHLFRIGHRRGGGFGGLLSIYLALHTFMLLKMTEGGHARAFAFPVMLMTIDGIDRNSERQSGIGAILGFALYPPAGLIALTTHGIWLTAQSIKCKIRWDKLLKKIIHLSVVTLICFLFVVPLLLSQNEFGGMPSFQEATNMPEFKTNGGRVRFIPLPTATSAITTNINPLFETSGDSPLSFLEDFTRESGGIPFYVFICLTLLLAAAGLTRPPYISLYVATAGIVLFGLAHIFAFSLYNPIRMLRYSIPVAALFLFSSSFSHIALNNPSKLLPRLSSLIAVLTFIAFFGIAFKGPIGHTINANLERELFQLLQTLPEEALFAGHPSKMDNIPLWAKRRILVSYETSNPMLDVAWKEIKERNYKNFEAYYASHPKPLHALKEKYGVDYMIVHEFDLSPFYARDCHYFEPFTKWVKQLCRKPNTELIWRRATPLSVVGKASGYYVIDLNKFLEELNIQN